GELTMSAPPVLPKEDAQDTPPVAAVLELPRGDAQKWLQAHLAPAKLESSQAEPVEMQPVFGENSSNTSDAIADAAQEEPVSATSARGFLSRGKRRRSLARLRSLCDGAEEVATKALAAAVGCVGEGDVRKWLQVAQDALKPEVWVDSRRALQQRADEAASALLAAQRAKAESPTEALATAERALGDLLIWRCQAASTLRSRSSFKSTLQEAFRGELLTTKQWSRFFHIHKEVVARQLPEADFK
ncbi:unnamed protein product, partial [Symbiodinium pilosum]